MTIRNRFDKIVHSLLKTPVSSKIKKLDTKKGQSSSNISTNIIKEFGDLCANFITENFNLCLNNGKC